MIEINFQGLKLQVVAVISSLLQVETVTSTSTSASGFFYRYSLNLPSTAT